VARGPSPPSRALRQFGVPAALATRAVAAIAIAAEAASAALLLIAPLAGYALACALLCAFTLAIASALAADRRVACRCFGASTTHLGRAHLVRNLVLVGAAVAGAAARTTTASAARPESGWLCIVVGVIIGAAITRWDDLAYLFGSSGR